MLDDDFREIPAGDERVGVLAKGGRVLDVFTPDERGKYKSDVELGGRIAEGSGQFYSKDKWGLPRETPDWRGISRNKPSCWNKRSTANVPHVSMALQFLDRTFVTVIIVNFIWLLGSTLHLTADDC